MNDVGINIRKIRERKGFSQEAVAHGLGINQSTYGKLEKENSKITIDRLQKIAEILGEDLGEVIGINSKNTFNQNNQGNGYVENFHNENKELVKDLKEVYDKLIQSKDEQITLLKDLLEGR